MAKRITEFTSATSLAETDVLPIVDVSDTTQATSGTTKKSALSLIADYIKTRVETLTNKTLSTGSVIDANVTVVEVLKKVYPVGSLYINASVATNPGTLLGFGTWEAFGQGRVMVGKNTSGTFATAGSTGGAETHTLTVDEIPSHRHTSVANTAGANSANQLSYGGADAYVTNYNTSLTGGGGAHNNLQPYIVVYRYRRVS
jgi:hypothetical protein